MSGLTRVWLCILVTGMLSAVGGLVALWLDPNWVGVFLMFMGGLFIGAASMTLVINRMIWGW